MGNTDAETISAALEEFWRYLCKEITREMRERGDRYELEKFDEKCFLFSVKPQPDGQQLPVGFLGCPESDVNWWQISGNA